MPVSREQPAKEIEDMKFEEALEIAGYGKFSVFIIFLSGIAICASFLSSLDVSFLLPAAECDLQLTSKDKGFLGSANFIGIIIASHLSGYLADTLGRRYVLIRGLWINNILYLFGSMAPNVWSLFVCKILSGIVLCPCMIAVFPMLGEYLPAKRRSQALLITTSLSTLGILYSTLVGWVILQDNWSINLGFIKYTPWRLFFLLCGVPSLLAAILLNFTPESPKFLLTRGRKGETMKVLQRVHSINSGKLPESFPVTSVCLDANETVPPLREKGAAGVIKHICDQTLPLFKPPYVKNLSLCLVLFFISFFCVNSVFLWLPEITNRIAHYKEDNKGRFYLCEMVTRDQLVDQSFITEVENVTAEGVECNASINTAVFVPNLILSVAQPSFMLSASLIVNLLDRRWIISSVMLMCSIMAFIVPQIANASVIILLFGTIPIFMGFAYNILSTILIELFPTYIRAMAVSMCVIIGRSGSMIGSFLFSLLIDTECSLLFHFISALLLCCVVVPFFFDLDIINRQEQGNIEATRKNNTIY